MASQCCHLSHTLLNIFKESFSNILSILYCCFFNAVGSNRNLCIDFHTLHYLVDSRIIFFHISVFSFARIVHLIDTFVIPTLFIVLNLHLEALLKESGVHTNYRSDDSQDYFHTPEAVAQYIHTVSLFT
jgi:hypothetical protein